jgi:hypothetical protein
VTDLTKTIEAVVRTPLEDSARMDAYYYSFERTGVGIIDRILSAVAIAGKGSHHTESWTDDDLAKYYDDGLTHIQRIQKAADDAAFILKALAHDAGVRS